MNLSPYINRELSWLEFNQRVLEEAWDSRNPALENLKFLAIVASNLDEFFEVRVAGLKQQVEAEANVVSIDGRSPAEQVAALGERCRRMVEDKYRCWREHVLPRLRECGVHFLEFSDLDGGALSHFQDYYDNEVHPVLTPLAIDPSHPFPKLLNKSLNVVVELETPEFPVRFAIVQAPRVLPRLLRVPDRGDQFVFLGDLIKRNVGKLFPGCIIRGAHLFRVTRNSNLYLDEEEAENLLSAMEVELRNRNRGKAVRLEVQADCPDHVEEKLLRSFDLSESDIYRVDGPVNFRRLMPVYGEIDRPDLKFAPYQPAMTIPPRADIFARMRRGDMLLHHPYESFHPVEDFIEQAADDPRVLAIKQTLYRTSGDSPFIPAMIRAAHQGKQVVAVIEIKARFDEEANIKWARLLEEAGVHVVYGVVGLKTHCKAALVVRRDADRIRRYVHLGTGNYHPFTARLYTDMGLLTCREDIGLDVAELFNMLTGVPRYQRMNKLLVSPVSFHSGMIEMIRVETDNAREGRPSGIFAKMNSLLEPKIIDALYEASQAGVPIRLLVRGICAVRAGWEGHGENIEVRSVVGRFLEHSRIFRFENGGDPRVFIGSADWMSRNCFGRIESCVPVETEELRKRVEDVLETCWRDTVKSRVQDWQGTYRRLPEGEEPFDSQDYFISEAGQRARELFGGTGAEDGAPELKEDSFKV